MSTDPLWREQDEEFFRRELASFLPHWIFDAHCHLWPQGQFHRSAGTCPRARPTRSATADTSDSCTAVRTAPALFLPLPGKEENRAAANAWVAEQARLGADDRGLFLAAPDDGSRVGPQRGPSTGPGRAQVLPHAGRRCPPPGRPRSPPTCPSRWWRLPIRKSGSLYCTWSSRVPWPTRAIANGSAATAVVYPGIRLILAHSGRGFQPAHNLEGLPDLAALENLYFDSSANCEPLAHEAVLRIVGHHRLLYGSDFYICHQRGRSVARLPTLFSGWVKNHPSGARKHQHIRPVLVGLEHLRALKMGLLVGPPER